MKRIILLPLVAILMFMFSVTALAAPTDFIFDEADVLSDEQETMLEQEAARISSTYDVQLYVSIEADGETNDLPTLLEKAEVLFNELVEDKAAKVLLIGIEEDNFVWCHDSPYPETQTSLQLEGLFYENNSVGDHFTFIRAFLQGSEADLIEGGAPLVTSATTLESLEVDYVMDMAGILSEEEEKTLREMAEKVTKEQGIAVYILTVNDYNAFGYRPAGEDIYYTATDFYADYDLGYGEEKEGALLMLSMNARDYAYITYGDRANFIFDDGTKVSVENYFLDKFSYNAWYDGFYEYIDETEYYIENKAMYVVASILVRLVITFVIGIFVALGSKKKLNSVKIASHAMDYIPKGGVDIQVKNDVFSHTTTTKTRIQTSSGGGGGGRSHSGGGFSGRSGKF